LKKATYDSLIILRKGEGLCNDRTEDESMRDNKRSIGLGGPDYTIGGDNMETK
jgi:hypothetical protein